MSFTYASGDRPLDGYTIKRGIGAGGFGEVYYAVADSGKEVALKFVQRGQQVELRGVAQCLNLKSPHLVQLHDVRTTGNGEHVIIMEYVAGPSLRQTLDPHSDGLPEVEVRRWLEGIVAGVDYLHSRGVVHRDLNPSNLFIEDGVVKIGDYGLSKFISDSVRHGHTQSIGTVHYMAPEIGSGRYGRSIDIYAVGVVLYEMLTGRVPFDGESPGEVLMKHLTDRPRTGSLPAPYRRVVERALAKKPEDRYATAADLLADLDPATAAKPQPTKKVPEKPVPAIVLDGPTPQPSQPARRSEFESSKLVWVLAALAVLWFLARGADIGPGRHPVWLGVLALCVLAWLVVRWLRGWHQQTWQRSAPPPLPPSGSTAWPNVASWLDVAGAATLAIILAGIFTIFLVLGILQARIHAVALVTLMATAGAVPMLVTARLSAGRRFDPALYRVVSMLVGVAAGAVGYALAAGGLLRDALTGWDMPDWGAFLHIHEFLGVLSAGGRPPLLSWLVYFGLVFLAVRFWRMTDPVRPRRVELWGLMAAAAWALGIGLFWPFPQPLGLAVVLVTALSLQAASPWIERDSQRKALRRSRRRGHVIR